MDNTTTNVKRREIRFRAFGKESNKMFYWSLMDAQSEWTTPDQAISNIMQFTGLRDKSGKEIYESDKYEFNGILYIVKWHNDNASFYLEPVENTNDCTDFSEIISTKGEIKGSIYEAQ